jgi:hypothetical protein
MTRGVDGYVNVWSAVILPAARVVVAALDLKPRASVIDIGAGTGAPTRWQSPASVSPRSRRRTLGGQVKSSAPWRPSRGRDDAGRRFQPKSRRISCG